MIQWLRLAHRELAPNLGGYEDIGGFLFVVDKETRGLGLGHCAFDEPRELYSRRVKSVYSASG